MPMLARPRRRDSAAGSYGLVLMIHETAYVVRRVRCDPIIAAKAFRLRKGDGTLYDVTQTEFGPECDCPDFIFRRDGLDPAGCKHIKALTAYGLIDGQGKPALAGR